MKRYIICFRHRRINARRLELCRFYAEDKEQAIQHFINEVKNNPDYENGLKSFELLTGDWKSIAQMNNKSFSLYNTKEEIK